ncbi:dNTP triphosphohydrolase [Corallococcus interemptor]|uniref:DNTP triphosphohydrolase n=1 Tax=Corallococcus interemptor TaxID=2316720 RepID=A0A3A8R0G6_9BACT|nr:dNTP triphosphohydrolase [Corallococcus interemptor]RKH73521.1 dNTP triphosphohydrolase [Corallococcus interemptor]
MALDWKTLLCDTRIREAEGGRGSTPLEDDGRTHFDRDYDRAVFSAPVRRLKDKTQVFPLEPNDAVRTRLTHSMEVSTLARGLARGAARWMLREHHLESVQQVLDIEAIAATCGLIHDLGNPPFGHAGEEAISSWFKKNFGEAGQALYPGTERLPARVGQLRNDFLMFEGNAQTLRIVSRLQLLADSYGLNLTVGTLSAAMKYTAASDATSEGGSADTKKPGYFASEQNKVDLIRSLTGTGSARNPIAYLVEACDDMVYATVDIEDGVKKGIVSWRAVEAFLEQHDDSGMAKSVLKTVHEYIEKADTPLEGRARDEALAQHFRTVVIGESKKEILAAFQRNYARLMQGEALEQGDLISASGASRLIEVCKRFGRERVYSAPETLRLETLGRRVIHGLMDIFWEGARECPVPVDTTGKAWKKFNKSPEGKVYNLLSRNYRTAFEAACKSSSLPPLYHRYQLVTDYVCGMTDTFACDLHAQLTHG